MRFQVIFSLVLMACGGSVIGPLGDGGGGGDGTTGSDGSSGNCSGGPPNCLCGSPVCKNGSWGCSACDDCKSLEAQLSAERTKLQQCCPTCKSIQCMGSVPDVCCPITIHSGDTTTFSALVMKYKSQCMPICPGAPCQMVPSGICDPVGMDPNMGRCR